MNSHTTPPMSDDETYPLKGFGLATIKMEGGIADPDEFVWECDCEKCQAKYHKWKEKFDEQQKELWR